MADMQVTTTPDSTATSGDVTLVDLVVAFARYKKIILGVPLLVATVAAAVSMVLPPRFTAKTQLLPPQQAQSSAAALLSQLGSFGGVAAGVAGLKSPNDLYIGMLRSRIVADKVIKKFDLVKAYDVETMEKARRRLADATAISSGKDGLISIEFQDTDKKLVAPLTNAYVGELIKLTEVLAVTEASQRRMFYEQQLQQARDNLTKAESSLKERLDSRGVISVDAESQAVMATMGRLRAGISAKEIQLNSIRAFMTPNHQEYKRAEEELASMRAEMARLEGGPDSQGSAASGAASNNRSGFESIKLLRDVKYYQMLYELLAKQYEVARLDEAKTPSVIQVLDPAEEPERRSGPSRVLIVVMSSAAALFLTACAVMAAEWRRRVLATPAGALRWQELTQALRGR
jgi:uncharacterized protein involved in exopolysaccharide biosynthesis